MKRLVFALLIVFTLVAVVSADTALIYPTDGNIGYMSYDAGEPGAPFSTVRGAASVAGMGSGDIVVALFDSTSTTNNITLMDRAVVIFNTSIIPDADTVGSSKIVMRAGSEAGSLGDMGIGITKFVIDGGIDGNDWNNFQDTRYASDIPLSSFQAGVFSNWSLNAAGISNISKTSPSGFMIRSGWDISNSPPDLSGTNGFYSYASIYNDEIYDQIFLETTYDSQPPVTSFSANVTSGTTPLNVGFSDGSANTPTSWEWKWFANETVSSTSQNPTTVLASGTYNVRLKATNAGGSDWENKTSYITVSPRYSNFTANSTYGQQPLQVGFTDISNGVPNDWDWYFFANETKSSDSQNPTVSLAVGVYNIRLYTKNSYGESDWENKTTYITVSNATPVSAFAANATSGTTPLAVTFTDSSTNNPANWSWYWYANESVSSVLQNPSTVFTAGAYNIRLRTGNDGGSDWENKTTYITSNARVSAFSANTTSGMDSVGVLFTDASNGAANDWDWYLSNDETKDSDLQNPTATFTPGLYSVRLYTRNAYGEGDWENKTNYINIGESTPPVAGFSANTTSGEIPLQVGFIDGSTNFPTNYDWYFGNGTKFSDSANPAVSLGVGTYTINLYVSNEFGGDWENKTNYITAYGVAPVADFTADDTSGLLPHSVTFADISTKVPTSWSWDFQNDGVEDSTTQNPTFEYTSTGLFSVKMTATNAFGTDSETKIDYITVSSPPPAASFVGVPTNGQTPLTVQFTESSTNNPTAWAWDFTNDGSTDSTDQNPSHLYTTGTYTVKMTATNAWGSNTQTRNNYIVVTPPPVSAGFTANSTSGKVTLGVQFSDTSANTPNNWDWYWSNDETKDSDTQNPVASFATSGSYSVRLYSSNAYGGTWHNATNYIYALSSSAYALRPRAITPLPTDAVVEAQFNTVSEALGIGIISEPVAGTGEPIDVMGVIWGIFAIFSTPMGNIAVVIIVSSLFFVIQISTKSTRYSILVALALVGVVIAMMPQNYLVWGATALACVVIGTIYALYKHP